MVADFKNKRNRNPRKQFLLYVGGFFLAFLLIFLVVANIRVYQKRQEFLAQVASLKNQIKDIQQRNNNLEQGITKASDSQYIEKVAREQLDLQKPGEKAVSFVTSPPTQQKPTPPNQNIFQTWWSWLVGKK